MTECRTCDDVGKVLAIWDRVGGPPGNGEIGCPDCQKGRAWIAGAAANLDAGLKRAVVIGTRTTYPLCRPEYQPNPPIGDLTLKEQESYERKGWDAWARGVRREDCPYVDQRRGPWQAGWDAAEQVFQKAIQEGRH